MKVIHILQILPPECGVCFLDDLPTLICFIYLVSMSLSLSSKSFGVWYLHDIRLTLHAPVINNGVSSLEEGSSENTFVNTPKHICAASPVWLFKNYNRSWSVDGLAATKPSHPIVSVSFNDDKCLERGRERDNSTSPQLFFPRTNLHRTPPPCPMAVVLPVVFFTWIMFIHSLVPCNSVSYSSVSHMMCMSSHQSLNKI